MRRTKEEARQTREKLLDIALGLFARNGYANTTLDEIAVAAGMTKGAIFFHFAGKSQLFDEICRTQEGRMKAYFHEATNQAEGAFDRLQKLLFAVVENFFDHHQFRQFIELTWYKSSSEKLTDLMVGKSKYVQGFLETVIDLLQMGIAEGTIRSEINLKQTALTISYLINGMYRVYFAMPDYGRDKADAYAVFNTQLNQIHA